MTIRNAAEMAPSWLAGHLGVIPSWLLGRRVGCRVGILTYHRVSPRVPGLPFPRHNVTPKCLEDQLRGLLARDFHVWPLRRVLEHREHPERIPAKTVVLTFDDAYQTVYTNAFPILKRLQLPASVFLPTGYVDYDGPMPFDQWGLEAGKQAPAETYRAMTMAQCQEMHEHDLIELGVHTHTHADHRQAPAAFRDDVQRSADFVREHFGVARPPLAFPFGCPYRGFASDDLVAAAKRTDVCCGLTTEAVPVDPANDPFQWGRFNVFSWDTTATLTAKLNGWYSWAPQLRRALIRLVRPGAYNRHRPARDVPRSCEAEMLSQ